MFSLMFLLALLMHTVVIAVSQHAGSTIATLSHKDL